MYVLKELQRKVREAIDDCNTHLHVHMVRVAVLAYKFSTKSVRQNFAGLRVGLAESLASGGALTDYEQKDC